MPSLLWLGLAFVLGAISGAAALVALAAKRVPAHEQRAIVRARDRRRRRTAE